MKCADLIDELLTLNGQPIDPVFFQQSPLARMYSAPDDKTLVKLFVSQPWTSNEISLWIYFFLQKAPQIWTIRSLAPTSSRRAQR